MNMMVLLNELAELGTIQLRRDSDSWNVTLIRGRTRYVISASLLAVALRGVLTLVRNAE